MIFSDDKLNYFKKLLVMGSERTRQIKKIDGLIDYLEASEKLFIDMVNGKPIKSITISMEHAASRYILKNAYDELLKREMVSASERQNMEVVDSVLELHKTLITSAVWDKVEQAGIVGPDGSIYWFDTYEQLDTKWASALAYYTQLNRGEIKKADFVVQANISGVPVTSNNVTIAIVGDWGSGPYKNTEGIDPSTSVMKSLSDKKPDFAIHLGDVYYNGTASSDSIYPNEEQNNFVDVWTLSDGKGFTLNSNHEMYSGGHGLFGTALTSAKFSLQQGSSYFALVHDKWVLFGLDSAYYDNSRLFMDGALIDPNQLNFIKGIDISGKKVIVMTHHNPIEDNGQTKKGNLWANVNSALGRDADFWYWGHTHNAIVYTDKANVGSTIARCVGHGAIPFTKAPELYQTDGSSNPEIAYYAGQELPVQPHNGKITLAKNGYAVLTITDTSLMEIFYDQDGKEVWKEVFSF